MLHQVTLHGALADQFGADHRFDVRCAAEIFRALAVNHPTFSNWVRERQDTSYALILDGKIVTESEIRFPLSKGDLHVVPIIEGGGPMLLLIGPLLTAAGGLLGAGFTVSAFGTVLFTTGGLGLLSATAISVIGYTGLALTLAGISSLLTPSQPHVKQKAEAKNTASYLFDGPVNTITMGGPVPVGYGVLIIGSQVISAGITINEQKVG